MIQRFCNACIIRDNQASGWTAQRFIGAHRHDVGPLGQGIIPRASRDNPALVGGIKQGLCADALCNLCDLLNGMGGQIQTAANGDQFWAHLHGQFCQTININRVSICQNGRVMDVQSE